MGFSLFPIAVNELSAALLRLSDSADTSLRSALARSLQMLVKFGNIELVNKKLNFAGLQVFDRQYLFARPCLANRQPYRAVKQSAG